MGGMITTGGNTANMITDAGDDKCWGRQRARMQDPHPRYKHETAVSFFYFISYFVSHFIFYSYTPWL
jgi:hypothetical protein